MVVPPGNLPISQRTSSASAVIQSGFSSALAIPGAGEDAGAGSDELARALAELPPPEGLPEPGPGDPPLVGRTAELGILSHATGAGHPGDGPAVILVAGEPGIGKTRLLRELVRQVRSAGGWVLSGRVFETEDSWLGIRVSGGEQVVRQIANRPSSRRRWSARLLVSTRGGGRPARASSRSRT